MLKFCEEYKMQNSSSDNELAGSSMHYNDSGYFTNHNSDLRSYSSNSNSEPSFEVAEEISLHSRHRGNLQAIESSGVYFCEDAVFDEPKLEGPPLLCDNANNYEQFSSLIKFSLEETSGSYLTNDSNLHSITNFNNNSNFEYFDNVPLSKLSPSTTNDSKFTLNMEYLEQESLNSLSSSSQLVCLTKSDNRQNIISQAVEQCLTIGKSDVESKFLYSQNNTISNSVTMKKNFEVNDSVKKKCTPAKNNRNLINSDLSPELFSEDDDHQTERNVENVSQTLKYVSSSEQSLKSDRTLLKRVQETLSGVPPPPSVTILQLSVSEMLEKIYHNKHLFMNSKCSVSETESPESSENKCNLSRDVSDNTTKSLLILNSKENVDSSKWPDIMNFRYHGLHYNSSKVSEDFEHYCAKYAIRYVGSETASSCSSWASKAPDSATKRRNARLRWGAKSPGRRLSHLARRRITFSSSNLQQGGISLSVIGNSSATRQLMIDPRKNPALNKRKSPRKSPWKKSPRKSPHKRLRTPNSSTKKRSARRLNLEDEPKAGCSKVSSTKRALFQSPDQNRSTVSSSDSSAHFLQKNKSKRALFMSPSKNLNCDKKRKRVEEDTHPSKFPRSLSFDVQHSKVLHAAASGGSMPRRNSEVIVRSHSTKGEFSDLHKQKMLWAVSEALRGQQIGMSHPKFREYASILCKIIKYLVTDLMSKGPRQPGSTSDRMLRIARQHCYAVTRGKTFDEIMQQIKEMNANLKKPLTGYVAPDSVKSQQQKNVLQDKVMNIESNTLKVLTKSPIEMKRGKPYNENNKFRNIKRQIVFDDNDVTNSNENR